MDYSTDQLNTTAGVDFHGHARRHARKTFHVELSLVERSTNDFLGQALLTMDLGRHRYLMFHVERFPPLNTYKCQKRARSQQFSVVAELNSQMRSSG